jgi:hypothetical protein
VSAHREHTVGRMHRPERILRFSIHRGEGLTPMRTSGAPGDGPLTYVPILIAALLLLALFGGPDILLRSIDTAMHDAVKAVIDTAKAAAGLLQR